MSRPSIGSARGKILCFHRYTTSVLVVLTVRSGDSCHTGSTLNHNLIGSLTGCPEIVLPSEHHVLVNCSDPDTDPPQVGQTPYDSYVSGRQEWIPTAVSLLTAYGKPF